MISRWMFYILSGRVSPSMLDKVLGKRTLDPDSRPVVNGPGAGFGQTGLVSFMSFRTLFLSGGAQKRGDLGRGN